MSKSLKKTVYAAVIGAVYAVLTMVFPFSYGAIQLRVSEILCVLPFFFPAASGGLALGCAISNTMSAAGAIDIAFGSLSTLLAGLCTAAAGRRFRKELSLESGMPEKPLKYWGSSILACVMPVIFNAPIIGAVLSFTLTRNEFWQGMLIFGLEVGAGEAIVMLALGLPVMRSVIKNDAVRSFLLELSQ